VSGTLAHTAFTPDGCVRVWKMWKMCCYLAGGGVALPAGQGLADQVAVLHHQHGVAAAGGVSYRGGPLRG